MQEIRGFLVHKRTGAVVGVLGGAPPSTVATLRLMRSHDIVN